MTRARPDDKEERAAQADPGLEGCPPRPSSTDPSELGFLRKPMVRWLAPRQLTDTAVRVVLSGIFGAYADRRDLEALAEGKVFDRSDADELWLDYVADIGDGWAPTYTVAKLLATEKLELSRDGEDHLTERGRLLVMGGDEVYPVAKRAEYENRLLGPYKAALPCTRPGQHPELFAIPGSHDWYDGLLNFTNIFCRQAWIGGWKIPQTRSYFAIKLPHRWWLWGLDIQFDFYIDAPQITYFSEVAAKHVEKGDRIVLCTAKPAWVGASEGAGEAYSHQNLEYFEREVVEGSGATVALYVASGLHHYCRYEEEEDGERQRVTSGGGGAFLYPTHLLPEQLELVEENERTRYRRAATYPAPEASKRLRKRLWLLPFRNVPFVALLGALHLLLALMLGLHLPRAHVDLGFMDLWRALWQSPMAVVALGLILLGVGAMVGLAHHTGGWRRVLIGLVHSLLQVTEVAAIMVAASRISSGLDLPGVGSLLSFMGLLVVLGGVAGGFGLAGYLWATNVLGLHANEAFGPLAIMDFKHFLRLHVGPDGSLTIFPIGIDRVCRRWRLVADAPADAPWFEPAGEDATPCLIESPVRLHP